MLTWTSLIYGFILIDDAGFIGWGRTEDWAISGIEVHLGNETSPGVVDVSSVFPGLECKIGEDGLVLGPIDANDRDQLCTVMDGLGYMRENSVDFLSARISDATDLPVWGLINDMVESDFLAIAVSSTFELAYSSADGGAESHEICLEGDGADESLSYELGFCKGLMLVGDGAIDEDEADDEVDEAKAKCKSEEVTDKSKEITEKMIDAILAEIEEELREVLEEVLKSEEED